MPSLRCYPSHGFIVGGYGIPAIPTPPSDIPPTELTEFTEAFGVEEPPTDFTDAHRWLGCVGFSHGIHGSFWWRRASHRFHRCSQMVRLRRLLSRNSQKLLAEKSLPQISQISQMVRLLRVLPRNSRNSQKLLAEKSLPQMRTDAHRWLGCVGFCGKIVL